MKDTVTLVAIHNFIGSNDIQQLSFPSGAILHARPSNNGWWWGECEGRTGWFPPSYCRIVEQSIHPANSQSLGGSEVTKGREENHQEMAHLSRAFQDGLEDEPILGGSTEYVHARGDFGGSPSFNPALEDLYREKTHNSFDNPFLSQDDARKENGLPKLSPKKQHKTTFFPRKKKVDADKPIGYMTVIDNPNKPTVTTTSPVASPLFVGVNARLTEGQSSNPTDLHKQLVLEQKALIEEQVVRRQQALIEEQKKQLAEQQNKLEKLQTKRSWMRGIRGNERHTVVSK